MKPMSKSPLYPSAASTWINCPAAHLLRACFPQESGAAANGGTEAHKYAAALLTGNGGTVGQMSREIAEAADWYVRLVRADIATQQIPIVEKQVECATIHPTLAGTVDACYFDSRGLHVYDLKTGKAPVSAFENWQLITYAAGLAEYYSLQNKPTTPVEFIIAQRWSYSAHDYRGDRWTTTIGALAPYWQRLRDAAHAALGDNPRTQTGEHCRYCEGRHACEAARNAALCAVDMSGSPVPVDTDDPAVLGYELTVLDAAERVIRNRRTGLEAQAQAMIGRGQHVPGWAMSPTRGSTVWRPGVPVADLVAVGEAFGVEMRSVGLTPKQAIAAGIPEAIVEGLAERTAGSWKLSPVSDKDARRRLG
jgi:hypothetical protein